VAADPIHLSQQANDAGRRTTRGRQYLGKELVEPWLPDAAALDAVSPWVILVSSRNV
jgi:hypothetical protein